MKKRWFILVLCMLLSGCSAAETVETLGPIQHQQTDAPVMLPVHLSLPSSAAVEAFGGQERVYDCDGYTLVLLTRAAGDFHSTVENLSGFTIDRLTIMESKVGDTKRYDWVWTAAGEEGDVLGRAAVLDDGNYHYCLYILAPAQTAAGLSEEWNNVFGSIYLEK